MTSIRVCYISEGESTKAPSSRRSLCTRRHSGWWLGELQLPRAHPLYIPCYVGGWKMCLKFQGKFKRVLFGLTVRSTEHEDEDFPRIAKGLGFEHLALETDAPYLPPPGHNPNHPGSSIIRHHLWPSTITCQCLLSLREQPPTSDGSSGSRTPPWWESWGRQATNPDPVWAPSHSGGTLRLLPFSPLTVLRPSSTGIACTVYCRVCSIRKDSTSALVPRGAAPYLLQTFPSWRLTDTVTWTLWPIS